ncbi:MULTISPECIES: hypothetical protein [unclassified Raoultella]|uniref:hypothetical protein n=1 Tax=unclassified Raoultella TaxID=2627600 RepID=UPI001D1092B4
MTDITELAQLRAELSNPAVGSKDHLRKLALSLVDALEKAQQRIGELETYSKTAIEFREAALAENAHLKLELEILESRTVTVKLPERYACELGYNAPDPNGDMLDRDDVIAALTDAGIKWEGE